MKKIKPETTLFLLISVDGKISTGDTDEMDVDKDYPKIKGIKEGLYQYYDLEKIVSGLIFRTLISFRLTAWQLNCRH